jgi:CubicO group peptidase (beta-lactamase class C family)
MFLKFGIAAAAAAGALLALPATAQAPAAQAPAAQRADALFAAFARPGSPGCALGVAQGGRTVLTRAWGMADLEHGIENGPATIFEAGSVSKQFTAAAILLLAQDGKLALGDDIRRYVPEMPDYGDPITIDHLLSHTSGLRDWGAIAEIEGWPRTTRAHSNADALAIIARQSALNYYPGRDIPTPTAATI